MLYRIVLLLGFLLALSSGAHAQQPRTQCTSTAVAAGTGDAIAIPLLPCTETTTQLILTFIAPNSTATPTISVNGQAPHIIVNFDGTPLGIGELAANQRRILTYNGLNWILLTSGGGGGSTGGPFDIAMFWPGAPPNNAIVRIAITRPVSCPGALIGSVGNARVAATGDTVVNINKVFGGTVIPEATATWPAGGTIASFSGSGITFASGDDVEFAFPASADGTLADIAITLQCAR